MITDVRRLPTPDPGRDGALAFVADHLAELTLEAAAGHDLVASTIRGGQTAADAALARFDVSGYADGRNEAFPARRRAASGLSPYIRHGLLPLERVWSAVRGPHRDVEKFRDELLWQEYARHWYARLGHRTRRPLRNRYAPPSSQPSSDPASQPSSQPSSDPASQPSSQPSSDPASQPSSQSPPGRWNREMGCIELTVDELEEDGWLVNQTRMWLASQWTVRDGADWRAGEDLFFRHLLDGSRAANRLGWQWTTGVGSARAYGFSRWQVEKRAPGLCASCPLGASCPIDEWPDDPALQPVDADPLLRTDPNPEATAGPARVEIDGTPDAVWITAESLGDDDPALAAWPDLPAVFVFDEPLLQRLSLSSKRLVFLTECLTDLGSRRPVELFLADPGLALAGRSLATTFAPVPGWWGRARELRLAEVHPWPWLRRPGGGNIASFSAWSQQLR